MDTTFSRQKKNRKSTSWYKQHVLFL